MSVRNVPEGLYDIEEIDPEQGILFCGDEEGFLFALSNLALSLPGIADELDALFDAGDLDAYAAKAHSLKSTSHLAGAVSLSELAELLEAAAEKGDADTVREKHPEFIKRCRALADGLKPYAATEKEASAAEPEDIGGEEGFRSISAGRGILFIRGAKGFVAQAVVSNLRNEGFDVVECTTDGGGLEEHKDEADVYLYYLGNIRSVTENTIRTLNEICKESHKTVCLIGDDLSLKDARHVAAEQTVAIEYKRPVEMRTLLSDMRKFLDRRKEFVRKKTILLVDDDPDFLNLMENWLGDAYEIDTAGSGKEAFDYLYDRIPDMILLDYIMPEQDGFAFLKQLRENHRYSAIPVIFLTGNNDKDSVLKVIDERPDGYILKTTPREQMLSAINRFFFTQILG